MPDPTIAATRPGARECDPQGRREGGISEEDRQEGCAEDRREEKKKGAAPKKRIVTRKPRNRKGSFGTPPPVRFDFDSLPDSAWLTSDEVAAVLRRSKTTPPLWRTNKNHPLKWQRVDNKPLYRVAA